jgi:hypothetical protein
MLANGLSSSSCSRAFARARARGTRALVQVDAGAFQIVKLALQGWKLSLLAYPGFFNEPFPILAAS